jgi:GAF domain-containing protein
MARRHSESRRDQLRVRARQQAAVAELGQRALAGAPLEDLIGTAAETSARELGTDYASVLELTADRGGLVVRTAVGFPPDVLGTVLPAEPDQLPGYALRSNVAVVTPDFASEPRFRPSDVQRSAGVVSAMAAPIGTRGRHFGVIGVHALRPHHFSADDAHFLTAVANVLGAAAERARHEEALRESEAAFRELADTAPVMLWTTDTDGLVTFVNEGWLSWTGTRFEDELGAS